MSIDHSAAQPLSPTLGGIPVVGQSSSLFETPTVNLGASVAPVPPVLEFGCLPAISCAVVASTVTTVTSSMAVSLAHRLVGLSRRNWGTCLT
jgi:hypothetical protein